MKNTNSPYLCLYFSYNSSGEKLLKTNYIKFDAELILGDSKSLNLMTSLIERVKFYCLKGRMPQLVHHKHPPAYVYS